MQGGPIVFLFLHGSFEPCFNPSNMVLLPKTPHASIIGHYRPIVLSNFMFKVIIMILANCLSSVASFGLFPRNNLVLFMAVTFNTVFLGCRSVLTFFIIFLDL